MTGRYPDAIWMPVPNFGYSPRQSHGQLLANGPRGAFFHDAQGWMDGAFSTFCDPNRGSAHFIFPLSQGKPYQFIDCDDAAWHCGGYIPGTGAFANLFYWGFEFEGGYPTPTPITDYQIQESTKVCRWLSEHYGFEWKAERRVDLWEHGEVYNTSCPNGRIRWDDVIAALKGGDMTLAQADENWIKATIADMIKKAGPKLIRINGQDEIMELRADGLFHIDGETYKRLGYDKLPVEVVAKDDPILKRRVSYPAGVPAEMH